MGLVLHGETSNPYNATVAATNGPDAVANLFPTIAGDGTIRANANPDGLASVERGPGVVGHSGPHPMTFALMDAHGITTSAMVEGRDPAPSALAQPALTSGRWIRAGGVVVERSFADALGVRVGDPLTLNGQPYEVAGIAVDAATAPYPHACAGGWCDVIYRASISRKQISQYQPGLIWLLRSDAVSLATPDVGLSYVVNLKLADPSQAPRFAASHSDTSRLGPTLVIKARQEISTDAAKLVRGPHTVLLVGSGLLILLAVASVAVLVGGRLSQQTRRGRIAQSSRRRPRHSRGPAAHRTPERDPLRGGHRPSDRLGARAPADQPRSRATRLGRIAAGHGVNHRHRHRSRLRHSHLGHDPSSATSRTHQHHQRPRGRRPPTETKQGRQHHVDPPAHPPAVGRATGRPSPPPPRAEHPQRERHRGRDRRHRHRARPPRRNLPAGPPAEPADDASHARDHGHADRAGRHQRRTHHLGHRSRRPTRVGPRPGARRYPPSGHRCPHRSPVPRGHSRLPPGSATRHGTAQIW
jgi:hypothetical protein